MDFCLLMGANIWNLLFFMNDHPWKRVRKSQIESAAGKCGRLSSNDLVTRFPNQTVFIVQIGIPSSIFPNLFIAKKEIPN